MNHPIKAIRLLSLLCGIMLSFNACTMSQHNDASANEAPSSSTADTSNQPAQEEEAQTSSARLDGEPLHAAITEEKQCGNHKGHTLYRGPKGGCYYYDTKGKKKYVNRELCDC